MEWLSVFLILSISCLIPLALWVVLIYPQKRYHKMLAQLKYFSIESTWNAPFKDAFNHGYVTYYGRISESTNIMLVRFSSVEYVNDYSFLAIEFLKPDPTESSSYPKFYGSMFRRMFMMDVQREYLSSAPISAELNSKLLRGVIDSPERQVIFYSLGDKFQTRFNTVLRHLSEQGYLECTVKGIIQSHNRNKAA